MSADAIDHYPAHLDSEREAALQRFYTKAGEEGAAWVLAALRQAGATRLAQMTTPQLDQAA